MRQRFLVFGEPLIEEAEIQEVVDCLRKAWLGTGPKVLGFEREFAAYKGVPAAAAVNSCTAALHLSCLALGLSPGDEVVTTAMTFCSTVNAIIHAGATPVLADMDPETLNISAEEIARKLTPRTRAILLVHFAGRPCEMDEILALARERDLRVIEDCAHAVEAEYKGRKIGAMGDFGCFSFYATKNVVTGEGGMVVSPNEAMLNRIKVMALHGLSADAWARFSDSGYRHYYATDLGFKYNMMDLQAALGIHQLRRVERNWLRRRDIWRRYMEELADLPLELPAPTPPHMKHGHHLFTVRLCEERGAPLSRDRFLEEMTRHKIGVGVHYLAIPEHPFYRDRFGWRPEDFPHATTYGRETVSLPISPKLTDQDLDDVIEAVREILT